jgi:2,4-dienoyl-CoA reductase-like NADH-dependent reductase (Old Yellow Enzyme family)
MLNESGDILVKPADLLAQPLTLANGTVIKNRFAKSAMSEALGTIDNRVTPHLANLYGAWARGGTGLVITGNVMIDRRALGEPCNVALEDERDLAQLQAWAKAGTANGTQLWMQLNHPGKQSPVQVSKQPVAPSAIPLAPRFKRFFNPPVALTEPQIENLIERFATSARIAQKAGFTGVQIHGAHGYLVSQFLSPHHNQRTDQWGGSLQNRARFVLEILRVMRAATGPAFPVSIKMNSADFQRGGFTEEESMQVAEMLADAGIDLIEISGGTYEMPQMTGVPGKASTLAREAYFLEFADKIRAQVKTPLMVTGGFRSIDAMAQALQSGATDLVGIARPLAVVPDLPNRLLRGEITRSDIKRRITGIKLIDDMAMMETVWYAKQLERIAKGEPTKPDEHPLIGLVRYVSTSAVRGFKSQRVRAN